MIEKSISSERGRTYYWTEKRESPFTLVFLPGLTANHHLFDRQTEVFSQQYSILVWDAPAHGKSRPYKDFSYHNAAEELKSIFDREGVKRAVLVGQSAGGGNFYNRHLPLQSIVLQQVGSVLAASDKVDVQTLSQWYSAKGNGEDVRQHAARKRKYAEYAGGLFQR